MQVYIKKLFVFIFLWNTLFIATLFGAKVHLSYWDKGKTFSEYLSDNNISADVLKNISEDDLKFLSDIQSDQLFYELKSRKGILQQVLIPIGEEMQIRLARVRQDGSYLFDIIPIDYKEQEYGATITIENNLHTDIVNTLHHPALADKVGQLIKGAVNARKFQKGDQVFFLYKQRTRMGQPYGIPFIPIAMYQSGKKETFIYSDEEGYGYTTNKKLEAYTITGKKKVTYTRLVPVKGGTGGSVFGMPVRHVRLTSSFSHRRWHPIIKRYRPHYGTDFGGKRGTPLLAVADGVVSFAGRMTGYGNVVKIKHPGGYESLYAHQSRIHARNGQRVKKGDIIGYLGNTGMSTGPHLHFGMMKYGKWIDPMSVLRKTSLTAGVLKKFSEYRNVTTTKYKEVEIKNADENQAKLLAYIASPSSLFTWEEYVDTGVQMVEKDGLYEKL